LIFAHLIVGVVKSGGKTQDLTLFYRVVKDGGRRKGVKKRGTILKVIALPPELSVNSDSPGSFHAPLPVERSVP
jgi:hypothetical protein